jgi:hypothetical protein
MISTTKSECLFYNPYLIDKDEILRYDIHICCRLLHGTRASVIAAVLERMHGCQKHRFSERPAPTARSGRFRRRCQLGDDEQQSQQF